VHQYGTEMITDDEMKDIDRKDCPTCKERIVHGMPPRLC
jgi:hypothetical protein